MTRRFALHCFDVDSRNVWVNRKNRNGSIDQIYFNLDDRQCYINCVKTDEHLDMQVPQYIWKEIAKAYKNR